jgi:Arc/MetJ-type ribon-helix-helix transcriptional regulator
MTSDIKKKMISLEVSTPMLDTIDDLRETQRGSQSRSSYIRELIYLGLKSHTSSVSQ